MHANNPSPNTCIDIKIYVYMACPRWLSFPWELPGVFKGGAAPDPHGPPWGPHGPAPCGPPWALVGRALMGLPVTL